MSDAGNIPLSSTPVHWREAALLLTRSPATPAKCPVCHAASVLPQWHLVDLLSRAADIDLECSACRATASFQVTLPEDVPGFYPIDRLAKIGDAVDEQLGRIAENIRKHATVLPAAAFTTDPLWPEARWSATTYQWHPKSEAPPVMGIVFDNAEAGRELFRKYAKSINHTDRFEELRVSIIEGSRPGERYGYSVHLCPDPDSLAAHATMDDMVVDQNVVHFLGQWTRAYPIPDSKPLLPKFKMEFNKHKEFLLAPAVRKADGQLWMEPTLGIIKNTICFRQLSEITRPDDPDAGALIMPELIKPAPSKDGGEGCFGG